MFTKYMLVTRNSYDDYTVCFTDDLDDINGVSSERGTAAEIKAVVRKALLTVKDLEKDLVRHGWVEENIGLWVYEPDMNIGFIIDTNADVGAKYAYNSNEPDTWSNDYQDLIK